MDNHKEMSMVCTICEKERTIALSNRMEKSQKTAVQNLMCIRCKTITEHKEKSVFELEKQNAFRKNNSRYAQHKSMSCDQIIANRIPEIKSIFIKCTLGNGLFFLFKNPDEAADWILMNKLADTAAKDTIIKKITSSLTDNELHVYGQIFSITYLVLYGKFCDVPEGYCWLKGCYLSESDLLEKECDVKGCRNYKSNC